MEILLSVGDLPDCLLYRALSPMSLKEFYYALHRIRSKIPISEIRKHADVASRLSKVKGRMTLHPWSEDDLRISNLGFFVGIDPSNVLNEEMVESIHKQIFRETNISKNKIPKFMCGFSTQFVIDDETKLRTSTKAYDIQCRQDNAKTLIEILQRTYMRSPNFIFHKIRHIPEQAHNYTNAILKQNRFLANSRIVPVEGVHPDAMFYVAKKLRQIPGVGRIAKHRNTASRGRWSVHTTELSFDSVVDRIEEHIQQWNDEVVQREKIDLSKQEVKEARVAFRSDAYRRAKEGEQGGSEDGSFVSYLTALNLIYTNEGVTNDAVISSSPPKGSSPAAQSWSAAVAVPSVVETQTQHTAANSQISHEEIENLKSHNEKLEKHEEIENLKSHNEKLEKEVDDLKVLLRQFMARQQSPDYAAIAMIVRETIKAERAQDATPQTNPNQGQQRSNDCYNSF